MPGEKGRTAWRVYDSPFRIGLATFYSMPSGASDEWGGVGGLHKLFGEKAVQEINEHEKSRIEDLIRDSMNSKGALLAFHKEFYTRIKDPQSSPYTKERAMKGELYGVCACDRKVKLFCLPPTRNIQGKKSLDLLRIFKQRILES